MPYYPRTVAAIAKALRERSREAEEKFGALSGEQLNWKPSPEAWSVGQCLDHLIVSNSTYFPALRSLAAGTHRPFR